MTMRVRCGWLPLAALLLLLLLRPSLGSHDSTADSPQLPPIVSSGTRPDDSIVPTPSVAIIQSTMDVTQTHLPAPKESDSHEHGNRVDVPIFPEEPSSRAEDAVDESVRKSRAISTRVPASARVAVNAVGSGYENIQPTKASASASSQEGDEVSLTDKWVWNQSGSGEGYGAPRGRQLRLSGPRGRQQSPTWNSSGTVTPSAPSRPVEATALVRAGEQRKTNPDIQDIITGIVNLLHGKAPPAPLPNVGAGRPLRPINTRINNRGPPRISDIPPSSLDLDLPPPTQVDNIGMMPPPPPRIPPPYPFETPQELPPEPLPERPENSHQNPAFEQTAAAPGGGVIPLPPQPSGTKPFAGAVLPEQVVPVTGRPLHPRPHVNVTRPGIVEDVRPNKDKRPGSQDKRPPVQSGHEPRPRPRPQPPKRRPVPTTTKKPVDIVVGNKKEEYVTVDEEAGDDGDMGISLTESGDESNEDVTFTTDHPAPPVVALRPVNVTRNVTTPTRKTSTSTLKATPTSKATPTLKETSTLRTTTTTTSVTSASVNATSRPKIVASMTSSASSVGEASVVESTTPKQRVTEEVIGMKKGVVTLAEGAVGHGEAHPVIESSMGTPLGETPVTSTKVLPTASEGRPPLSTGGGYRPRPGIVLDDTEYKPLSRPVITAPPRGGQVGEVFDVTVSAIQGPSSGTGKPYVYPVEIDGVKLPGGGQGEVSVITAAEEGQHFVSIDGKRTYINLFGDNTETAGPVQPTVTRGHVQPTTLGTGSATPALDVPTPPAKTPAAKPHRPHNRRPGVGGQPPVRIDTCIVGDASTCDAQQNERCLTETGVSSCHCRQGYARRKHREPCRRVVSIAMSLRVDKLYDRRVAWSPKFQSPDSEEYRQLQYEASRALDSAMSMTPFSDEFMGARVINVYPGGGVVHDDSPSSSPPPTAVFVNVTLQLEENAETARPAVKHDIQRHLLGVIHRRNNNVGDSALWVDSPPGSVSQLQDIDECTSGELNDCHAEATCANVFGSFRCACVEGTRDPWAGNVHRQGRQCETCAADHCHQRGQCRFDAAGQQVCSCSSGFYGSQCEVDGEVLGVAIGASVAAVIIIALTLVCLCMWSRRWSREQKSATGPGSPVFGYMAGNTVKTPHMGGPPYQVSMEDRLRWAQIADVMAQANHYAQPEPVPGGGPTRPSSAVFGYPTLSHTGHLSHMGTLPSMHHGHMGTLTHSLHGTMQHGKMPLPPVPLPRHSLPHNAHSLNRSQAAMSVHGGGYSIHGGGTYNPHAGMRTPDTKKAFDSSSSDEEDRTDLLGRNFHVPRPKSRSSVANQSGIYYDVDTDQADLYSKPPQQPSIPMSLYGMRANNQYFMQ